MRVLIAEDRRFSRQIIASALEDWGYDVVACSDGTEAWSILRQSDSPQLAILDWLMPGIDGPTLCEKLRERQGAPYVYTILLTVRANAADVIAGLEAGADDYIAKPVARHELRLRVRTGARIIQLQKDLLATQDALRHQATHDSLTGLWNRAAGLDALERELARCGRDQSTLAVLLADIDHFKGVNDAHGHQVGDAVLREVAQTLAHSVRPYDVVARYGGEEFLCILPQSSAETAMTVAERLRARCESRPMVAAGADVRVTVTIGIGSGGEGCTAGGLIQMADDGLYRAKAGGRNRVALGSRQPASPAPTS